MSPDLFAGEKIYGLRASDTPKAEWLRDGMFSPKYQLVAGDKLFAFYKPVGTFSADAEFAIPDGRFRIVRLRTLDWCYAIERADGSSQVATIETDGFGAGTLKFDNGLRLEVGSQISSRCSLADDTGVVLALSWNTFFGRSLELYPAFDTYPQALLGAVVALHITRSTSLGALLWWD